MDWLAWRRVTVQNSVIHLCLPFRLQLSRGVGGASREKGWGGVRVRGVGDNKWSGHTRRGGGKRKKMHKCRLVAAREEKRLARFNLLDASQISVDRSRGSRNNQGIRSPHQTCLLGSAQRLGRGGGIISGSMSWVNAVSRLSMGKRTRWFPNTQSPKRHWHWHWYDPAW